jgi:dihydrofolate reductase
MEKRKANGRNLEDVFVCGGDSIYEQLLPYCDTVYVTFLEKLYDADRRFQNLDKSSEWQLLEESDEQSYFDITYYFRKYGRHLKN